MLSSEQRWKSVKIARGNSSGGELKYVKGHFEEDKKVFTPIALPEGFEHWRVVWCSTLGLEEARELHLLVKNGDGLSSVKEYNAICILEALPAQAVEKTVTYWYKAGSKIARPDLNGGHVYTWTSVWAEDYQDASDVADQMFYRGRYDSVRVEVNRPVDLETCWTECEAEIVPHIWVSWLVSPDGGEYINGENIPVAEYEELLAAGWHAGD